MAILKAFCKKKVAEKLAGAKLGGSPERRTSMLPPIDCKDVGFTEITAETESSNTEKKGEFDDIIILLDVVTETLTAKRFTEDGAFTRIVATVDDVFDGSK